MQGRLEAVRHIHPPKLRGNARPKAQAASRPNHTGAQVEMTIEVSGVERGDELIITL